MQGVGSQSGLVIDDFTLTKPAGWQPNTAAKTLFINQGFQSNYTETFLEVRLMVSQSTAGELHSLSSQACYSCPYEHAQAPSPLSCVIISPLARTVDAPYSGLLQQLPFTLKHFLRRA